MEIVMLIFAVFTLISACGVVFSKRALHSALSLVATMFFIAVHFALLRADFLAALQIMIYAGAIMVLVVFVIMLLGIEEVVERRSFAIPKIFSVLLSLVFAALLMYAAQSQSVIEVAESLGARTEAQTAAGVGKLILTDYFFAFQVIALLLLAAIVGAVVLAHDKRRPLAPGRGLRAMQALHAEEE